MLHDAFGKWVREHSYGARRIIIKSNRVRYFHRELCSRRSDHFQFHGFFSVALIVTHEVDPVVHSLGVFNIHDFVVIFSISSQNYNSVCIHRQESKSPERKGIKK